MVNHVVLQGVFNSIPKPQGKSSVLFKLKVDANDFSVEVEGTDEQITAINNYLVGGDPIKIKGKLYRPGEEVRILVKRNTPEHGLFFLTKGKEWIDITELPLFFHEKVNYQS